MRPTSRYALRLIARFLSNGETVYGANIIRSILTPTDEKINAGDILFLSLWQFGLISDPLLR